MSQFLALHSVDLLDSHDEGLKSGILLVLFDLGLPEITICLHVVYPPFLQIGRGHDGVEFVGIYPEHQFRGNTMLFSASEIVSSAASCEHSRVLRRAGPKLVCSP